MTILAPPSPIGSVPVVDLSAPEEESAKLIQQAGLSHGFFYGEISLKHVEFAMHGARVCIFENSAAKVIRMHINPASKSGKNCL